MRDLLSRACARFGSSTIVPIASSANTIDTPFVDPFASAVETLAQLPNEHPLPDLLPRKILLGSVVDGWAKRRWALKRSPRDVSKR